MFHSVKICLCSLLLIGAPSRAHSTPISTLYSRLNPTSVAQHFAFYELYPDTSEGRQALQTAWQLLSLDSQEEVAQLPQIDLQSLLFFVNRTASDNTPSTLEESQLQWIEKLAQHLPNRKLPGYGIENIEQLEPLTDAQVDLARGLLLADLGDDPKALQKVRSYEAHLDLMALQILARLPLNASAEEKIYAINQYIFSEMRFRFPPHSLYAKEIDLYTFLPSVLDQRRGVCLGVSILYLSLAQRLDLSLQAVTPPGHIYVSYQPETGNPTNIETTARGIDIPSERYLGIETKSLQKRSLKEVIGLAFMNQAAVRWHQEKFSEAIFLYERAGIFLKEDYLLKMFLGFNYLFVGREKEGKQLLSQLKHRLPPHMIQSDSISEDYLAGHMNPEAIRAVFLEVDETRESILNKQQKLQKIVEKFPRFRAGYFHLAITWLQLGREKEALPLLETYAQLAPQDATAQYYLCALHLQRRNFPKAWAALQLAEKQLKLHNHHPQAIKDLKKSLLRVCPEPL